MDLSRVSLSPAHEEVVNLLAENDHNVWARERIKQGWTYGAQQVYILCCITALFRHIEIIRSLRNVVATLFLLFESVFLGRESEAESVPRALQPS